MLPPVALGYSWGEPWSVPRPMSIAARCAALLAAGAIALAASGCGDTVIDSAKADGALQTSLERSLKEKVSSVDCPSGQKVEPGATFICSVKFADGQRASVEIKIVNEDADVSVVHLQLRE